ncbi:uncharacterized protein [Parasteatoda tepidariorum]|uniref:uncharacterized protein n=1 Tax=Parasteatoda tepidariorum TaxID=114398 RepID=UPI00077FAFC6|nr:uncharacterized protein LOC107453811 [Parasteatoda tepidariorum]
MENKIKGGRIYKLGADGKVQTAFSIKVIPYSEKPKLKKFTLFKTHKNYDVVIENKVIADKPGYPGITRKALNHAMEAYMELYEDQQKRNKSNASLYLHEDSVIVQHFKP